MKILVAGSNGFLGRIICDVLHEKHEIVTLSRKNADINVDMSISTTALPHCDILVHCFGSAHFAPKKRLDEKIFFDVNVRGTENLLKSIEQSVKPKAIIFISSVSVYGLNSGLNVDETYTTSPNTPYGVSKLAAEEILSIWAYRNNVNLTILRLPLVIGLNPKGNLNLLIRAIMNGYYFRFSKKEVLKSVVLAEDVANLIPMLIEKKGIYNLTDGNGIKTSAIENHISQKFNKNVYFLPFWFVQFIAFIGDIFPIIPLNSDKLKKLNCSLTFSSTKARKDINWNPNDIFNSQWL